MNQIQTLCFVFIHICSSFITVYILLFVNGRTWDYLIKDIVKCPSLNRIKATVERENSPLSSPSCWTHIWCFLPFNISLFCPTDYSAWTVLTLTEIIIDLQSFWIKIYPIHVISVQQCTRSGKWKFGEIIWSGVNVNLGLLHFISCPSLFVLIVSLVFVYFIYLSYFLWGCCTSLIYFSLFSFFLKHPGR